MKIAAGQGSDYTTGFLLHCLYFHENCKSIAINWNKQQALDSNPKSMQPINFTENHN